MIDASAELTDSTNDSESFDCIEYNELVKLQNVHLAWEKFRKGKMKQSRVAEFWLNQEYYLFELYHDLAAEEYRHGGYRHFVLHDVKKRDIHVADVRDRIVHQLIADYLEKIYSKRFYLYSCSSQKGKGTSLARNYAISVIHRLQYGQEVWLAKADVRKYFENVDHEILLALLEKRVKNKKIQGLCRQVIESFGSNGKGIPLGNLTSQWLANIYLHELDFYAKQQLRIKYYIRYNDDIMILGTDEEVLKGYSVCLRKFAVETLKLEMPQSKIVISRLPKQIDILGLCTNGTKTWLRKNTVAKARSKLIQKSTLLSPDLLDSICSYGRSGVKCNNVLEGFIA
jgi:RNA-directed DNA polymerase